MVKQCSPFVLSGVVDGSFKTVWDYLNLLAILAIPVLIAAGTLWFTNQQSQATAAASRDQQEETALQTYLDRMSDLVLTEHLSTSHSGDEVRQVARARTLTILPRLNGIRKGEIVQFLSEAGLLQAASDGLPIVDLSDANLNGVNLSLSLADALLGGLHLRSADFRGANLVDANLGNDDLSFADFRGADLSHANLFGATGITPQQLGAAASLSGTLMPDGTIHP